MALGTFAVRARPLPFTEPIQSGLDTVRGARSESAQRELLDALERLRFVGVASAPGKPAVRRVIEEAWFTGAPLSVRFRREDGSVSARRVRLDSVVMKRTTTLLDVVDVETAERRQYPLHGVDSAHVVAASDFTGERAPR
ncbi:MAG: hypothetical protein AB1730_08195 [Myxococcota bacterium]